MKLEIIVSVCLIMFTVVVVMGGIGFLIMEATDKLDTLREKAPWFMKYIERRESLNVLLLACIFLLLGNGYELVMKEVPETPLPPIVKFPAPVAPPTVYVPKPVYGGRPEPANAPKQANLAGPATYAQIMLLHGHTPLNGQELTVGAPNSISFSLSDLHAKNDGHAPAEQMHMRIYFSEKINNFNYPVWIPTDSDEKGFPSAFYSSIGGRIDAGETWNLEPGFSGNVSLPKWNPNRIIKVKLKFFYGSLSPSVADFSIRQKQ